MPTVTKYFLPGVSAFTFGPTRIVAVLGLGRSERGLGACVCGCCGHIRAGRGGVVSRGAGAGDESEDGGGDSERGNLHGVIPFSTTAGS